MQVSTWSICILEWMVDFIKLISGMNDPNYQNNNVPNVPNDPNDFCTSEKWKNVLKVSPGVFKQ